MRFADKLSPTGLVLLAVLLWSTGGIFIKLTDLNAFAVNAGRSFLAALVVAVFTYKKGLKLEKFTILTSLLYAGTLSCFVYATKTTYAANAIFLQYTAPVYILLLSPFILKEKFKAVDLITVVLCLIGMSLFFFENQPETSTAPNVFLGNLVGLLSGLFFGLYFIFLRHPKSLKNPNTAISVFYGNLLVVLMMMPFIVQDLPKPDLKDILAIFFLGVFQIGLAYIFFTEGIARGVRSLDASIIGFVEPLLNPVWVFIFLGEVPSKWALVGGLVIIATVAFHTIAISRQVASTSDKMVPKTE
ncbi:MAG: EamA/RhaT family transporter [Acidobacteria bacterium]|jgi:drug/metabolite transporter (DMT)-like permease|nr:MAG: EamA/RhaT family transporter [Acidobacteriota bacterium]GIU81034.1 MAG: membrane protein [Pyrinomonadaceae bacterium]